MNIDKGISTPIAINERLITRAYSMVADAERLIAEQRQRIKQLEQLSFCDPLTGLLNRRGFESAISRELRGTEEGVVILVDLDGFKQVNDTFGHLAGDAYLQAIANFLTSNCRPGDVVSRMGGDEFAILMPRTKSAAGQRRAAALMAKLNQSHTEWDGTALLLRASFGAAGVKPGAELKQVLDKADGRLYAQKSQRHKKAN